MVLHQLGTVVVVFEGFERGVQWVGPEMGDGSMSIKIRKLGYCCFEQKEKRGSGIERKGLNVL